MQQKDKLPIISLISLGGALFSMHFGASSMIWPMTWGKESGSSIIIAFLGVYLTAVFIPLLGYFALARGGSFLQLSKRVSNRFASIFCNITILVLGPLFVIPRMSAAAWEAFLQITGFLPRTSLPILIFTILYYSLVSWFVAKGDSIMDQISKILLPVLVLVVIGVVTRGLKCPISAQGPKIYDSPPFIYGLIEGYATVELPTALLLGGVLISNLRARNIRGKDLSRNLIIIGIIGTSILALSHFAHMYIGSTTKGVFEGLKYSSLYAAVVVELWGAFGGIIFNIGLLFAALSCAVGLTSASSHFYEEYSQGRLEYKFVSKIVIVISGLVGILGLEVIVEIVSPLLKIIYPPAIVLTISHALISDLEKRKNRLSGMRYSVYIALIIGSIEGLMDYLRMFKVDIGRLEEIFSGLPMARWGLAWLLFAVIASILGNLVVYVKDRKG